MKMLNIITLLFLMNVYAEFGFSQVSSNLEDYLKIKVFESTRNDVKKIYGNPERIYAGTKEKSYWEDYMLSNGIRVSVKYSRGNCSLGSEIWNVPEGKVTEITYSPLREKPDLKKLISGKIKFNSRPSGDVGGHIEFYNDEKGVNIYYDEGDGGEGVMDIEVFPSLKYKQKYKCS
ncbi:hypothetical protein BH20ACI4_BH20ACI4_14230 [soil metagenome]